MFLDALQFSFLLLSVQANLFIQLTSRNFSDNYILCNLSNLSPHFPKAIIILFLMLFPPKHNHYSLIIPKSSQFAIVYPLPMPIIHLSKFVYFTYSKIQFCIIWSERINAFHFSFSRRT